FSEATDEEKKLLLRLFFSEVKVTPDRKKVESVKVSLFENGNLPLSEIRGTVPQVMVKQNIEITIEMNTIKKLYENKG
uniref:hypothetical protein n=1 Tax=Alkalibacillus haloalkaliphilus TaxID=94136 RepID=UPI00058CE4CF